MESASFHLKGVAVAYNGHAALDNVDLKIAAGEAVGLVGPSGAGKTTLLRLLNATRCPTEGTVEVGGEDISRQPLRRLRVVRSRIGVVHQDLSLVPNLRVVRNVLAGKLGQVSFLGGLRLLFVPPRSELRRVYSLLERVGIAEKLYERTDRLSGGQRQRVAIARALYQDPAALLADEPVSSVDPARARDTVALLAEICRERKLTLCMSLHNLELAREFLPRLVGLRGGRVVFDRKSDELDDADFADLYDLAPEEMLADGSG